MSPLFHRREPRGGRKCRGNSSAVVSSALPPFDRGYRAERKAIPSDNNFIFIGRRLRFSHRPRYREPNSLFLFLSFSPPVDLSVAHAATGRSDEEGRRGLQPGVFFVSSTSFLYESPPSPVGERTRGPGEAANLYKRYFAHGQDKWNDFWNLVISSSPSCPVSPRSLDRSRRGDCVPFNLSSVLRAREIETYRREPARNGGFPDYQESRRRARRIDGRSSACARKSSTR